MSNHRQTSSPPGPSLTSIVTMAAGTLIALGLAVWIAWGATDERHTMGVGLGLILTVLMTAQTIVRISDRQVARARQQARGRRYQRQYADQLDRYSAQMVDRQPIDPEDDRYPQSAEDGGPAPRGSTPPRGRAEYQGGADETKVIRTPPVVAVPVFRNEAQRMAWLHERHRDTEVIPRIQDGTVWPS